MKRILITLLVLIVAALAGGAYFIYLKVLIPGDVPAKVISAEEVIATSGTIAIASVDMSYVRQINKAFSGIKDPSPLPAPKSAKSKTKKSFLDKLKKQGINLISQTDYALATINVTQNKPAYTFVLFGRFSRNKFKQAIQQNYLIDESANGYWLITKLAEPVKELDPCAVPVKKSPLKQQALHIQKDRIILSSTELMPVLLKRFASNARAGVSLTKWRQFRKDKAVAGVIMSPQEAKKGATDLPSALLLGAISNQPLNEVYAGAVVSLLPSPGFTFLLDAHSSKPKWPIEVKTKYDAWLSETVSELKGMPTLVSLFQSLKVQADGNVLRFRSIANQTTLDNLEKVPGEFLKMAFSGAFSVDEKPGSISAEKIVKDSEVEKYSPSFNFSSVQPYDGKDVLYKPDYVVGPFGVRLKRIGLLATDDSVIELRINVEGKGFENLSGELMHKSDDSLSTSLSITSVEDEKGNNLLREELCGKKRNLVAEYLTTTRDKQYVNNEWLSKSIKVFGDKSVRLKQNVPLSKVANISGKIVVRAATRTKAIALKAPFAKKTIKTSKVRMYLKNSNLSTVKYDLSGEISRIVAVRAKNIKGQYLADDGSSASSYEGVKTVSKRFKGKVASIEVIVAEQMKSQEYPFAINKIVLQYGKKSTGLQVGMKATSKRLFLSKHKKVKYKEACKDKQKVVLGSFRVCLNKFGDQLGQETGGEFDVVAPYDEALQNDMTAGVLSIDTVLTESGEKISFKKSEKFNFEYKFEGHYNDKKKDWEIINKRLYASYVKVFSDKEELKNKKISVIKGTLTIRIPKRPKHFDLAVNELGVIKKSKNGLIANISAFEDWNTYIDLQGPVDKVMRFMPVAKGGIILKTGNDRIAEKKYQTWGLSKEDKEKIKLLPKKWEGMITIYGKPELIRVYYADSFELINHKFKFSINK